jgi:hypothetical protein
MWCYERAHFQLVHTIHIEDESEAVNSYIGSYLGLSGLLKRNAHLEETTANIL